MFVQGVKANYDRASELYNEKRYAEALELLNELNRATPNHPKILHSRALVLAALGRLQDAEAIATHLDTVLSYSHVSELKLHLQDKALNSVDRKTNSFRSDVSFSLRRIAQLGAFGLICAGIGVFGTLRSLDISNEQTLRVAQIPISPSVIREGSPELIESGRNSVEEQIALGDLEDDPPEAANSTFQPGKSASVEKPEDRPASDGNIAPDTNVVLAAIETFEAPIAERFDSGVEETAVTHNRGDPSALPREAPSEFEKISESEGEFRAEIVEDTLHPAPIEKVQDESAEVSEPPESHVAMSQNNERHSGEFDSPAILFVNELKSDLPEDSSPASIDEEAPETTVASENIEPGPEPAPSLDNSRTVEAVADDDAPSLEEAEGVETVSTPPVTEEEPKTLVVAGAPTDSGQDTLQRTGSIEHSVQSSPASIDEETPETTVASENIEPGPEPATSLDNSRTVEAVADDDAPSLEEAEDGGTVSTPPVIEEEPKTVVVARAPIDSGQDTLQRRGSIRHTVRENESLTEVASLYGVSAANIVKWNDLQQAKLQAGSTLTIYLEPERPMRKELSFEGSAEGQKGTSVPDVHNLTYMVVHTVVPGDTLLELSKRYKVSTDNLALWNGLEDAAIQEGQNLTIFVGPGPETAESTPELKTVQYDVQPGDTLSNIAWKFATTSDLLLQINKIKDPSHIFVGQKLRVPAG